MMLNFWEISWFFKRFCVFSINWILILYTISCFFKKCYVGAVSMNHQEIAQIADSGFLKKVHETGQIPACSFYLLVSMSQNVTVLWLNTRTICDAVSELAGGATTLPSTPCIRLWVLATVYEPVLFLAQENSSVFVPWHFAVLYHVSRCGTKSHSPHPRVIAHVNTSWHI